MIYTSYNIKIILKCILIYNYTLLNNSITVLFYGNCLGYRYLRFYEKQNIQIILAIFSKKINIIHLYRDFHKIYVVL